MTITDRRSRRTETLPAKLGAPDTAEAGHVLINKLRGLPSPSRQKGARDAASGSGTLLGSGSGQARSSYREMLRASGQQALLRVQNNEPAAPAQRGAQPSPPGKVVTFQSAGPGPAPSLLLSGHMAPPGDASVRSTTSAPCLPSNAFCLPYASPAATPSNASTTPMVQLPDMSPDTGRSRYWPDRSPTFCMERVPELMPENSPTDLLSIAMPQARRMDREQIAAHLRAAAPEVYED